MIANFFNMEKNKDGLDTYRRLIVHDLTNVVQNTKTSLEIYSTIDETSVRMFNLKECLGIMKKQFQRGLNLVGDFFKINDLVEKDIVLSNVNYLPILREAINNIKEGNNSRKTDIILELESKDYEVSANFMLQNLFENLLFNAIKHNANDLVVVLIKVSTIERGGTRYLKFEFIDNGVGVHDSIKTSVFGRGIGLSLIHRIVTVYSGDIWVENRMSGDYSKGSKFVVLIPASQ